MMKVKLFTSDSHALLERDINEFLKNLGSDKNIKVNLTDIKLSTSIALGTTSYIAMVIYNEFTHTIQ